MALRGGKGCWNLPWARSTQPITAAAVWRIAYVEDPYKHYSSRYRCQYRQGGPLKAASGTRRVAEANASSRQLLHTTASAFRKRGEREAEIAEAVDKLTGLLERDSSNAPKIWSVYDRLKIRKMLPFISYETWASLLKTCQREPAQQHTGIRKPPSSRQQTHRAPAGKSLFPLCQVSGSVLTSAFGREFVGNELQPWSRKMAKVRVLMILKDMWKCSDPDSDTDIDSQSEGANSKSQILQDSISDIDGPLPNPMWRPTALHYNIAFDVVCRDPLSAVDELISLHRNMRLRSVQEDTITFNTLLNGCRRMQAWKYFRAIDQQLRKRDEWGVTRMDATTWGTLIQGYKECMDWSAVDSCVAQASAACHSWHKSQETAGAAGSGLSGIKPTSELLNAIINVYAVRDMVPQMIASRKVMQAFQLPMSTYTFAPIFAALHRLRKDLIRGQKDAWPAIILAVEEFEAMRECGIAPNATILTNAILTLALSNPYGRAGQDQEESRAIVSRVGESIAQDLEAMMVKAQDPNIYAAVLNISGKEGRLDDIKAIWQTLETESQFTNNAPQIPLLSSLTLSAYMHALINCCAYDDAIAVFYKYVVPQASSREVQTRTRKRLASPTLQNVDRSVYEASIKAFALADRHRMCPQVIHKMVNAGIEPSVFTLRYMLLAPSQTHTKRRHQNRHARRWSLPLAIAREAWDMVLATRRAKWLGDRQYKEMDNVDSLDSHSAKVAKHTHRSSTKELPVIVNDIAAQFIRIAAYARNVQFGEQIFEALESEGEYFGISHHHHHHHHAEQKQVHGGSMKSDIQDKQRIFPDDLQCAPNVRTYTSMIALYGNDANLAGVSRMWAKMLHDSVEPNLLTYTSLINALHKVALRKRWKRTKTFSEMAASNSKFANSAFAKIESKYNSDELWWGSTKQDQMICQIEDQVLGGTSKLGGDKAGPVNISQQLRLFGDCIMPDLDIPLSTLLLRYHTARIHDTLRDSPKESSGSRTSYAERDTAEDIKRAMQVCQAVEDSGLVPDYKFHSALADFFETCGDSSGAELVRSHMESTAG